MSAFMQYVYSVLWFVMAFLLVFKLGKENRVFYLAGGLFFVFGIWWLIDAIAPQLDVFGNTIPGYIFKALIAIVLVIACLVYYKERKKSKEEQQNKEKSDN